MEHDKSKTDRRVRLTWAFVLGLSLQVLCLLPVVALAQTTERIPDVLDRSLWPVRVIAVHAPDMPDSAEKTDNTDKAGQQLPADSRPPIGSADPLNVANHAPENIKSQLSSNPQGGWSIRLEDERIDLALHRWARSAGLTFRWDADQYFPVLAPTDFKGSFDSALRSLLSSPGILKSSYPLEACVYANSPPLLRITRLGDQTQECR